MERRGSGQPLWYVIFRDSQVEPWDGVFGMARSDAKALFDARLAAGHSSPETAVLGFGNPSMHVMITA